MMYANSRLLRLFAIDAARCFGDDVEEGPDFNGKNLDKMDVYKFTLSDQNQTDFHLLIWKDR